MSGSMAKKVVKKRFKINDFILREFTIVIDETEYFNVFNMYPVSCFLEDVTKFVNNELIYMFRVYFNDIVEYKFSNIKFVLNKVELRETIKIGYKIEHRKNSSVKKFGSVEFVLSK